MYKLQTGCPLPAPRKQLWGDPCFPALMPLFPHSPGFHLGIHGELAALHTQQCRAGDLGWARWYTLFFCSWWLVWGWGPKSASRINFRILLSLPSPLYTVFLSLLVPQSHRQPSGKHEKSVCLRMETTCKKWKGRKKSPSLRDLVKATLKLPLKPYLPSKVSNTWASTFPLF